MNDGGEMKKEDVVILRSLIPTDAEIAEIKEEQRANPSIPLGSAEEFLMMLSSIGGLKAILDVWFFKLDFGEREQEICETINNVKNVINTILSNETFLTILSVTLAIGNILNKSSVAGFHLDYLEKLSDVRDTENKEPLVQHIAKAVLDAEPSSRHFYGEIQHFNRIDNNFEDLERSLEDLEKTCKPFLANQTQVINSGRRIRIYG